MKPILLTLLALASSLTAQAQTIEPVQLSVTYPQAGTFTLEGTLTMPAETRQAVPVVLLIAGSGSTDRDGNGYGVKSNTYRQLADSLAKQGVALLRYDKRLVGKSKPAVMLTLKEDDMRFSMLVDDAVGLIEKLKADKRFSTVIVAGHSEGALVGILAARQAKTNGYVSIAGPGRGITEVLKEQLKGLPDSLRGIAYKDLDSLHAGQRVRKSPPALNSLFRPSVQPYMISWMKYDPTTELKTYAGPVLIIQGKHDLQVPVSEAKLLKAARPDAKLVMFDDMNHMLKNAPADVQGNRAVYNQPDLPLTPGLVGAIAEFAKKGR